MHTDSGLNLQPLGAYHVYSLTMNLNHQQGDLDTVFMQVTTALTQAHNLLKGSTTLVAQLLWVIYLTNFKINN